MPNRQKRTALGMQCFVAMRIGDRDTDAVYERLIAPTIRRIGLTPRRIDRVMHNERIDQKILREIQECVVMVSDLTFARPSVYWEAGLVEGLKKPVVYTCRRDHFHPRQEDEYGNYKIHFDLQTKKIVPWASANDRKFSRDLERQLQFVLRPFLRAQAEDIEQAQEERKFLANSLDSRRSIVLRSIVPIARRLGFSVRALDFDWGLEHPKMSKAFYSSYTLLGAALIYDQSREVHTGHVFVPPKLKKSLWQAIGRWKYHPLDSVRVEQARKQRKAVIDHYIVISFAPVPSKLINETLSDFQPGVDTSWASWFTHVTDLSSPANSRRTVWLHVIGNVRSERDSRDEIMKILASISNRRKQQKGTGFCFGPSQ